LNNPRERFAFNLFPFGFGETTERSRVENAR
jgi:hypothetical protein